jgi:signal transduction histidine kinase
MYFEGKAAFAMPHLYKPGGGMTVQSQCVNLAIASPTEIERTARQLMAVRDDFLSTGSLALRVPRPLILDSWQRCRMLHVNPSRRCAPLAVTRETQLAQLRDANVLLIQAAQSAMNYLIDFLAGSGYVVVLTDVHGYLLDVAGDASIRRRLERIDFVPGGNWSEAAAGTNAIGTALADGHIVQLMAAEHYCDGWQDLTCTATPIRHPLTNEIVGILDVTGDYRLIRPFLTSFLAKVVLEIQQNLRVLVAPCSYEGQVHNVCHAPVKLFSESLAAVSGEQQKNLATLTIEKQSAYSTPTADIQGQLNMQERRAYDAERLASAASIISASLDLDVTIEKVNEQVLHLLRVERTAILLFNAQGQIDSIHTQNTRALSRAWLPHILQAQLKATRAIALIQERGEPVTINDTLASPLVSAQFMARTGIRALMLLPLVTARGVSGCILVVRSIPYSWTVEEIRLGLAIATQSAISIENACLFDALQRHNRHIETLNAIAQILNTFPDLSHHIDLALRRIIELLNVDTGLIMLFDQASDDLTVATQWGLPEHAHLAAETWPWQMFSMLARRVILLGESLIVRLNSCDDAMIRQTMLLLGLSGLMAVPLATTDTVLGVLFVSCCGRESALQEELKFFSTIGQQLGLAIGNAQLRRSASEMVALREADRLKSGFLAAVSHDLRSPLTAIRASVESLLDADSIQSVAGREQLLRNIAGQANRLGLLVDQLLDLSRIEAGALPLDCDWVELTALIDDTVRDFERLHSGSCVERMLEPELPLLYIDVARFGQVLWNLLENAYKYSTQRAPIQVSACTQGHEVLISVADRGPGIPQGEHERVFQRFYRLDRERHIHTQGSGLGLAICRGIIEAHGGRIWIEDREGGGCIFLIAVSLPEPGPVDFEASGKQVLLA